MSGSRAPGRAAVLDLNLAREHDRLVEQAGGQVELREPRERREDALDLVAGELELVRVDRVDARDVRVRRRAGAAARRPR